MSGRCWCSWCCCCVAARCICYRCCLCKNCCRCPPPCLPCIKPMPQLPCMPCMGPSPPPIRVIKEHIMVPYPVPVPVNHPVPSPSVCCAPYCPTSCYPMSSCNTGGGDCCPYYEQPTCPTTLPPCYSAPSPCCYEPDPEFEIYNPRPPAFPKRTLYSPGKALLPGYAGHVPELNNFGAGRTMGAASKDTWCIMSQWRKSNPPQLPRRIFEQ